MSALLVCNAEVPVVVDWVAEGGVPDEVALLAIATSTDAGQPNFPPTTWLQEGSWPSRVMLDDEANTVAAAFGVSSFPFWVVLDADGRVLLRTAGELTPAQLDGLVQIATGG